MFVKPALIDEVRHPSLYADLPEEKRGKAVLATRDPVNRRVLAAEGANVPETPYWHRRLRDKDVTLEAPPEVKPTPFARPADAA